MSYGSPDDGGRGYAEILDVLGCNIIIWEEDEDYQGDILALVTEEDYHYGGSVDKTNPWLDGPYWRSKPVGYLNIGFGSCSGCDAYEATRGDVKARSELVTQLANDIKWFDNFDKLCEYVTDSENRALTEWAFHEDGGLWNKFLASISGLVKKKD